MTNSITLLADLRAGRCSTTSEVRLLRFWEARNVKKSGKLMSFDMLLIDEKSTLIHGSITAAHVPSFIDRFNAGSVYTLACSRQARKLNKGTKV